SLLADADKRKNEFLAVLAHELRNPLGSIVNGMFALRRSSAGSAEAEQAREIIERQSRHMVRLIDDLLDIARISEGRINMERERVDISEVVRLCVEDHAPQFERSRI